MIVGNKTSFTNPRLPQKLALMKQFVKALDRDGTCFRYLYSAFPGMSMEKIKAEIFNGPQIRQLMKDSHFARQMAERNQRLGQRL